MLNFSPFLQIFWPTSSTTYHTLSELWWSLESLQSVFERKGTCEAHNHPENWNLILRRNEHLATIPKTKKPWYPGNGRTKGKNVLLEKRN